VFCFGKKGAGFRRMPIQVSIPTALLGAIKAIGALSIEQKQALLTALRGAGSTLSIDQVRVAAASAVPEEAAGPIVNLLLSLAGLRRREAASGREVYDAISKNLQELVERKRVSNEDIESWRRDPEAIASLFELEGVSTVSKALELAYEHEHILRRIRLVTDLRPVFDDKGLTLKGFVVSQTIRVSYRGADGERDLSVALDDKDVRDLLDQCQRALDKAAAVNRLVADRCEVPVMVVGERTR
jgi:hypothetical protein